MQELKSKDFSQYKVGKLVEEGKLIKLNKSYYEESEGIYVFYREKVGIEETCHAMDAGYVYDDIQEIRSEKDIENLEWASGGFHDARIAKKEIQEDRTLYLRFDGTWGCEIEVWFRGDVEYDTSGRDSETSDPYWFGSTVILQDGFVYFIDDNDMTVERITSEYCYFKARHMEYRIIPD